MSQQYAWMLALMVAWRQRVGDYDADDQPDVREMARISAVVGQLRHSPGNAANDLAARLLVLIWVWWLFSAKTCANSTGLGPFARKLAVGLFLDTIARHPAIRLHPGRSQLFPVAVPIPSPPHNRYTQI